MKRLYLITPFVFALSFILYINYWVLTLASLDQFFRLLFVLWLLLGLLMYPAYYLTRDWEWATILLTVFVFGFYFSQSFFLLMGSVVLIATIMWQLYFRLRGFEVRLTQFFVLLNGVAVFIIALALYLNIRAFAQVPWGTYFQSVDQARTPSIKITSSPVVMPDIYYIVLDGYLRSDMLENLYGYDNTPLTTYLQQKGFIVPANIHSNYAKTAVSVPSTLNMNYVGSYAPGLENSHFWWLMTPFIDHSQVRAVLESQGYKTISFSTDWSLTDNPTTDIYLHAFPVVLTDYERYILDATGLGIIKPLIKDLASIPSFDTHRTVIQYSFESLQNIPEMDGPKFVFAHILSPHPPFVFDKNGAPINPPGKYNTNDADDFYGSSSVYKEGYIGQVEFVNAQLRLTVNAILKKSKTPPIILIQADHGSGLLTDFSSAENTCIKERFSPFAAYYLPGMEQRDIPSDLTTVNLFRIIFNHYFEANLPLLENKQYYYEDTVYLFRPVDVTSRIDEECRMPLR
ncbi:MAG TPA: sulfatase-like hydrolase/transferase [Anaerolineales bacterium]|nr:sulfatase-like hydrolase/transferase [Anaerolineales bacterium]